VTASLATGRFDLSLGEMPLGRRCRSASCCHAPAELLQEQQPGAKLQRTEGRGHSQELPAHLGRLFWEETAEDTYCSSPLTRADQRKDTSGICCFLRTDFILRDGFS